VRNMNIHLSRKQQFLFEAVSNSRHTKTAIAEKAGVGRNLLWMHLTGKHEPTDAVFIAEIQAIYELG
jgi:hypothetical protein